MSLALGSYEVVGGGGSFRADLPDLVRLVGRHDEGVDPVAESELPR